MTRRTPLRLTPQIKEVVWGGDWLAKELGRPGRPGAPLGESWEAYSGSAIPEGEHAGRTLGDLFAEQGKALFGPAAARYPRFPLLVKFIDAHQNLSVQVHPNDEQAMRLEGYPYGKTEYWYVMEAAPGAEIVYGLERPGITREELQSALASGNLLRYCRRAPVRPGDVVFIPAGTVHALTEGVVVYELQQDSDITYRLYDWGRVGREIHLEKGLESIGLERHSMQVTHPEPEGEGACQRATLARCELFRSELLRVRAEVDLPAPVHSFTLLSVIEGAGALRAGGAEMPLRKGDTVFLPAGLAYMLAPQNQSEPLVVISSTVEG